MERELRFTDTTNGENYWYNNGAYQTEYKELFDKLVPPKDESETHHGELIRIASRFIYDWGNNGFGNVVDVDWSTKDEYQTCCNCGGSGEVDGYEDDGEMIDCDDCSGTGEVWEMVDDECTVTIDSYFDNMLDYLINTEPTLNFLDEMRSDLIIGNLVLGEHGTSEKIAKYLNEAMDKIMHLVLTTENKPRIILYGSE